MSWITFTDYLSTSDYQFGFKRKSSTSHAIHCLKESINYYTQNGSNVFCSFLDASKAFDRLVHAGLLIFLNIIIYWYSDLQCRVRWGETLGEGFGISAGVRQGGILTPTFYCIYVDELVQILSQAGIGSHIRNDMCLISTSIKGCCWEQNSTALSGT